MTCPICQKCFPGSEIEAHAAECGDEGNYSGSDQSLPPVDVGTSSVATTRPIRQTTASLRYNMMMYFAKQSYQWKQHRYQIVCCHMSNLVGHPIGRTILNLHFVGVATQNY